VRAFIMATGLVLASATAASAVPNVPTLYPDNSYRYKYGWANFDNPIVFVNKGSLCTIELNEDESLPPADANPVIISDTVRWRALTSRGGGQRLPSGKVVPFVWTVSVQPMNDAHDALLIIHTTMGRRYMVRLIAVDERDKRGEELVGFYPWHPAPVVHPRQIARRQAQVQPKPSPSVRRQRR
jgi:hypothetical protein